jgi:hypothetical protein
VCVEMFDPYGGSSVCVCGCVLCGCACMRACVCVHVCACLHVDPRPLVYHRSTHTQVHTHPYIHVYVYAHTYAYVVFSGALFVPCSLHSLTHTHTHTHTHNYTHIGGSYLGRRHHGAFFDFDQNHHCKHHPDGAKRGYSRVRDAAGA